MGWHAPLEHGALAGSQTLSPTRAHKGWGRRLEWHETEPSTWSNCRDAGLGRSLVSPRIGRDIFPAPRKRSLRTPPCLYKYVLCGETREATASQDRHPMSHTSSSREGTNQDKGPKAMGKGSGSPRSQPPVYLALGGTSCLLSRSSDNRRDWQCNPATLK